MSAAELRAQQLYAALAPLASNAPAFSSAAWLLPWLAHYWRPEDRFCLRTVTANDTHLVAPLMIRKARFRHLPVRELRFLGTGDAAHEEVVSEYVDVTLAGEQAPADGWATITRSLPPWDLLRAEAVLSQSTLASMLRAQGGWRIAHGFRYRLALPQSFEQWLTERSQRRREKFRRSLSQLDASGCVWREGLRDDASLQALRKLHQARWQRRDQPGAFASQRFFDFHRQLLGDGALGAQICGWFRGQQPVALWYGFDLHGCRYFYQSGFDPQESQLRSPGEALHLGAIRQAIASGLHHYDFMRAPADSWKAAFGASAEPLYDWLLPGQTWRGRLISKALAHQSRWQRVR